MDLYRGICIGGYQQTTVAIDLHVRGLSRESVDPASLISRPDTCHLVVQEHAMGAGSTDTVDGSQASHATTMHQAISPTDTNTAHVPDGGARRIGGTMLEAVDRIEAGQGENMYAALTYHTGTLTIGCQQ